MILRPFGKNQFWSSVRNLFRSEEKEEMIQEIDPEELKRNKEEYETELRASLNGEEIVYEDDKHIVTKTSFNDEPDNRLPYIVATRIDDGVKEISESALEAVDGVKVTPDRMEEGLREVNQLSENGVQPLTDFKPILPPPFQPIVDFNGDPGYVFPKEPEIFIMGQDDKELRDYVDKKVASANKILEQIDKEKGIPVGDGFGNVLFHTTMTMPAPEGMQIRPADKNTNNVIKSLIARYGKTVKDLEKSTEETFRSIRESMGEPGPMSTDDPLFLKRRIPPPDVYVPVVDQIKANVESVDIFFPKVVTINVSGIVGTGKTYILAKIEEMLKNDLSATVTSSALDDEEKQYGLRKADLAQHHLDMFHEGKIVFDLTETYIRDDGKPFGSPIEEKIPFPSSLQCPCCD